MRIVAPRACKNRKKLMTSTLLHPFSTLQFNLLPIIPLGVIQNNFFSSSLNLSYNMISSISSNISKWHGNSLVLSNNRISSISPTIVNISTLASLNLDGNLFTEIPKELLACQHLKHLSLANNSITNADIAGHLINNNILASLDLSTNKIQSVHSWNVSLNYHLTNLLLGQNEISQIPKWLVYCYILFLKSQASSPLSVRLCIF